MPAPPSIDTTLSVRVAGTDAAFRALHAPWNALVDRIGGCIFLRHEWYSAAWAWRRTEAAHLCIVCVYAGEQLVGLLPLLRPAASNSGARLLQFLGVPDSQWCDALIDPRCGPRVAGAMVGHLLETAAAWDVLRLERLALRSSAATWLAPALAGKGLAARVDTVDCNLYVDLTAPWADYQARLSRSIKKTRNLPPTGSPVPATPSCNGSRRSRSPRPTWRGTSTRSSPSRPTAGSTSPVPRSTVPGRRPSSAS